LLIPARRHATNLGPEVSRTYNLCGVWLIGLWFIYPIAWGVCEGANIISPDSEAVFYGVLDLLAKGGFGALLLWGHRNIDPAVLGLRIRAYDEGPGIGYHRAGKEVNGQHGVHQNGLHQNGAHINGGHQDVAQQNVVNTGSGTV